MVASKRKATCSDTMQPSQKLLKTQRVHSFSTAQKNAIAQFIAITGCERNAAAKLLKNANWNTQQAANTFFSNGQSSNHSQALEKQFQTYQSQGEDPEKMDVTATQRYFTDLGVSFEGVDVFVASQIVQSASFGEISKDGFVKGWSDLNCDTLAKQKALIQKQKKVLADTSNPETLDRVYRYAFVLMMQNPGQRSADKAMCIEFWKVLLSQPSLDWTTPTTNWREVWIDFVTNHKSIKAISRDQWNHVLKFARLSLDDPTLSFHNEEQSWPSIIDEFVEEAREKGYSRTVDSAMEF